jgi:hypothetical protein
MNHKEGDKVIYLGHDMQDQYTGHVYTIDQVSYKVNNGTIDFYKLKESLWPMFEHEVITVNISKLEKIIYGVSDDN